MAGFWLFFLGVVPLVVYLKARMTGDEQDRELFKDWWAGLVVWILLFAPPLFVWLAAKF